MTINDPSRTVNLETSRKFYEMVEIVETLPCLTVIYKLAEPQLLSFFKKLKPLLI
jgi:hypothetical protein